MKILILILVIGIVIAIAASASNRSDNDSNHLSDPKSGTIRCPTCGSPATVRGNEWECGWCGDCGKFR